MIVVDVNAGVVQNPITGNSIKFVSFGHNRDEPAQYRFTGPAESFLFGVLISNGFLDTLKEFPEPNGGTVAEKLQHAAKIRQLARERGEYSSLIYLWSDGPASEASAKDLLTMIHSYLVQAHQAVAKSFAVSFSASSKERAGIQYNFGIDRSGQIVAASKKAAKS